MGLSRQGRIITLLVIDTAFFFLELIVGYSVGSLALVADSFHMLNDVLSLIVALYTIRLATSPSSNKNSYGWQRAEILGALINGVFLVALCFSIALEAVGRLVTPPEISNPKLIVVVGSLGLASNIVGLFLFHEHGHSHGPSHGPVKLPDDDVEGGATSPGLPQDHGRNESVSSLYQHPAQTRAQVIETAQEYGYGRSHDDSVLSRAMSPPAGRRSGSISGRSHSRHGHSHKRSEAEHRKSDGAVPRIGSSAESTNSDSTLRPAGGPAKPDDGCGDIGHPHHARDADAAEQGKGSHAHSHGPNTPNGTSVKANGHSHGHGHGHTDADHDAHAHGHDHTGGSGGGGHDHGNMNMRGVFLHVMGDALGNVGVIAAGLVVMFVHHRWALYFDPGVSLVISGIILHTAIPLCKSASYILMQAVPSHVSLEEVREDVQSVPGVKSVHELHVWQLSESTTVASVHVHVGPGRDYMEVASGIREMMHGHGIHSVTIQPE